MMSKSTLDYSNELCYNAFDISERCTKFMGYDNLYDETGSTINVISTVIQKDVSLVKTHLSLSCNPTTVLGVQV